MLRDVLSASGSEEGDSFYDYYEEHGPKQYKRAATLCFIIGSALLTIAIAMFAYLKFDRTEENTAVRDHSRSTKN